MSTTLSLTPLMCTLRIKKWNIHLIFPKYAIHGLADQHKIFYIIPRRRNQFYNLSYKNASVIHKNKKILATRAETALIILLQVTNSVREGSTTHQVFLWRSNRFNMTKIRRLMQRNNTYLEVH